MEDMVCNRAFEFPRESRCQGNDEKVSILGVLLCILNQLDESVQPEKEVRLLTSRIAVPVYRICILARVELVQ